MRVGRGVLIGQSARRLLAFAREAIDSTRAGTSCYRVNLRVLTFVAEFLAIRAAVVLLGSRSAKDVTECAVIVR